MSFEFVYMQILSLGLLGLAAHYGSRITRRIGLGEVVGQVMGGLLVGPVLLLMLEHRFPAYREALQSLHFFTFVFLSLIAFGIGDELHIAKLKRLGSRVLIITAVQAFATWFLLTSAFLLVGFDPVISLIIGSIGIATAPAATFAMMNRLDIGGRMRETLSGMVVLDDLFEIIVFSVMCQIALIQQRAGSISLEALALPVIKDLGAALLLGFIVFILLRVCIERRWLYPKGAHRSAMPGPEFLSRLISEMPEPSVNVFIMVSGCVSLGVGLALHWHLPFLITAVSAGMLISNFYSRELFKSLSIEGATSIFTLIFFVLIGANADLESFHLENLLYVLLYVSMRLLGKIGGTWLGCKLTHTEVQMTKTLPQLMLPQAGVAAIEAFYVASVLGDDGRMVLGVIIPGLIIFEVVGVLASERALLRWRAWVTGEKDLGTEEDRIRERLSHNDVSLADIIRPDCLCLPLEVENKGEAIWELVRTLQSSGQLENPGRALGILLDRERQGGIRLGEGVALPHGRLQELERPVVALGILPEDHSIAFGGSDDPPVDIIFLVLSPEQPPEVHLKVLARIAQLLTNEEARILLRHAKDKETAMHLLRKYSTPPLPPAEATPAASGKPPKS